jgi:hypothetical protein
MKELPLVWDLDEFNSRYAAVFQEQVGREATLEDVEQRDENGRLVLSCLLESLLIDLIGERQRKSVNRFTTAIRLRSCFTASATSRTKSSCERGVQSDFAGILLRGRFKVDEESAETEDRPPVPDCWSQPGPWERSDVWYLAWYRWLSRFVRRVLPRSRSEAELAEPVRYGAPATQRTYVGRPTGIREAGGQLRSLADRITGVTSTIWNQPRNVTLVADSDPEDEVPAGALPRRFEPDAFDERGRALCQMLLVRRAALERIVEVLPQLFDDKVQRFLRLALPRQLADNRLFRDSIVSSDVADGDWPRFVKILQGHDPQSGTPAVKRIRRCLTDADGEFMDWLSGREPEQFSNADRYRVMGELRSLLRGGQLYQQSVWPGAGLGDEAAGLASRNADLTPHELVRLNRLLIESSLAGVIQNSDREIPDSLYTDDVAESDWPTIVTRLNGSADGPFSAAVEYLRKHCEPEFLQWLGLGFALTSH